MGVLLAAIVGSIVFVYKFIFFAAYGVAIFAGAFWWEFAGPYYGRWWSVDWPAFDYVLALAGMLYSLTLWNEMLGRQAARWGSLAWIVLSSVVLLLFGVVVLNYVLAAIYCASSGLFLLYLLEFPDGETFAIGSCRALLYSLLLAVMIPPFFLAVVFELFAISGSPYHAGLPYDRFMHVLHIVMALIFSVNMLRWMLTFGALRGR